jgi:hypothetical protein
MMVLSSIGRVGLDRSSETQSNGCANFGIFLLQRDTCALKMPTHHSSARAAGRFGAASPLGQ